MIRWLLRRKLDAEEKKLGASVDYLRHVVDVSPAAFLRFASILPFANSRKVLPTDAWFVAQLVAVRHEDCGTCVQITVNLARQSGVAPALLRAVLLGPASDGDWHELSPEMADVARFAEAVVTASPGGDELRETLRHRYGERGLIELAYAIASGRIPPTVKRALGYARSCSVVPVEVR
jgi:alkylhydroperoxidase family enzyme